MAKKRETVPTDIEPGDITDPSAVIDPAAPVTPPAAASDERQPWEKTIDELPGTELALPANVIMWQTPSKSFALNRFTGITTATVGTNLPAEDLIMIAEAVRLGRLVLSSEAPETSEPSVTFDADVRRVAYSVTDITDVSGAIERIGMVESAIVLEAVVQIERDEHQRQDVIDAALARIGALAKKEASHS